MAVLDVNSSQAQNTESNRFLFLVTCSTSRYASALLWEIASSKKHPFVGSRAVQLVTAFIEALANADGEGDFGQL